MQRPFLLAYLVLSLLFYSALGFPTALVPRGSSEGTSCNSIVNGCPNLDFNWHMNQQTIMQYTLDVTSVSWVQDNTYQITIHVKGEENIDLKYLWSLKIIGVTGPKGTVQLYGYDENTYLIDNPTDFTATFEVYATQDVNSCQVWMPDFQIQFEYLQGSAAQYASSWKWGTTSFSLSTGCNNYDNQGHSQTDFPGFYWNIDDFVPPQLLSQSTTTSTSTSESSTTTSSTSESSTTTSTTTSESSTSSSTTAPATPTTTSCSKEKPTPPHHDTTPCTKKKTTTSKTCTKKTTTPVPTPSSSTTESSSTPVTSSTTESSSAPVPTPSSSTTESSSAPVTSSTTESSSAPVPTP
ncbi:AEL_collapsed_G0027930.mRNA.1.CDS.1 [Saccharomyces cerevisiae]|nr:AEL_collapsed_G0027930.mRNA.1.CDS.1 [Saccharomyces cerevisiae]